MSFPLMRLPFLAAILVIKNLDVEICVYLSQGSSKTKRLVKLSKVHIRLIVYPYSVRLLTRANRKNFIELPFSIRSEKAGTQRKIPFEPIPDEDGINRREEGYRKMIDDFNDIFIFQTLQFNLKSASASVCYNYLEYAKSIGLQPTTVQTMLNGANEEVYRRLLTAGSGFVHLAVYLYSAEDFIFDGFAEYAVDDFRLFIPPQNINWFTVDHMCALINCRLVLVYHINWTSEDFNEFLQFWMVSDGRLQSLVLWGQWSPTPDNLQDLFDEIDHREIIENEKFEIQRVDGVKAHVACGGGEFSLKVIIDD